MSEPTLAASWLDDEEAAWREAGLHRKRRRLESASGPHVRFRGQDFVNFASNDYLNLAADARLARSAAHAARKYGTGAGASALIVGHLPVHRRLERALARWQGSEAALVTTSGFTANLAVVGTLAGPDDVVFSDELNHASLIDGCRLSRARVAVYRHRDLDHLEDLLRRETTARRRLLVTDSLFSMDGDIAPLAELAELARRHDCLLVVDDAHAVGVLGENGTGLCGALAAALGPDRFVKVGTLSKALGAQGGFICASRRVIDWLVNRARAYVFSTALAPTSAAAGRRAVEIVRAEPERRATLLERVDQLHAGLRKLGHADAIGPGHIVPIVIGDARATLRLSKKLEAVGLIVPAIRPPTVPAGASRLRISLSAGHSQEDIDRLLSAL